jgi:hypothetical protein
MWFATIMFKFLNLIMAITNEVNSSTKLVYSWMQFSTRWCFVEYSIEYSWHQQCLQVEMPTTLVNNEKHVLNKRLFLEYS